MKALKVNGGETPLAPRRNLDLKTILNLFLYPLSALAPRSPRRWVFGDRSGEFVGNPKYLFLWIALNRPDIEVSWITGNEKTRRMLVANGFRAHRRWSLGGIVAALRAKVYVFGHEASSVNLQLSKGAFLVNLWHGVGPKGVKYGYKGGGNPSVPLGTGVLAKARSLTHVISPDIVATTSDFWQAHYAGQFRLPPESCPQLGYPRLDCSADPQLMQKVKELDQKQGFEWNPGGFDEIYIYLPTFRDTQRPFFEEALPDLDRLSRVLAKRNALLYVKPHMWTQWELPEGHRNIERWPSEIDFNPYLSKFTGLITDYSSVLCEYLHERPTGSIVYSFDYNEYISHDRTLCYPFEEHIAGLRVSTFDELCDALGKGAAFDPALSGDVERLMDLYWSGSKRPASPAIVDYVERRLASADNI